MRRVVVLVALVVAAMSISIAPVAAAGNNTPGQKEASSTTLDACGYFVGVQTANKTSSTTSGTFTTTSANGTWTGVDNNYGLGPVASLGSVHGSFTETSTRDSSTGAVTNGTETFRSDAGQIDQTFSYDPATGWHVSVTATRSLSFLTSDTNGHCYTGAFPRP